MLRTISNANGFRCARVYEAGTQRAGPLSLGSPLALRVKRASKENMDLSYNLSGCKCMRKVSQKSMLADAVHYHTSVATGTRLLWKLKPRISFYSILC